MSPFKHIRIFLKIYYYLSRLIKFFFITLKVLWYGLWHPQNMFNFFYGVVTEISEFHKRCGGLVVNFNKSKMYRELLNHRDFPKSNFFNADFGTIRPLEAQVMASLVLAAKPKLIFEIGTYNGFSTLHLLKNAPMEALVYTLDLPEDKSQITLRHDLSEAHRDIKNMNLNQQRRLYLDDPDGQRVKQLMGDSMQYDFSPYYGKIDLMFVDANHSYDYVKKDSDNAFKMISSRGLILWHDYDFIHPEIFRYINELAREKKIYYIERTRFAVYINQEK